MIQLKPITHLTNDQHAEAARLLNEAAAHLHEVSRIVGRAPFSDLTLKVGKAIQEVLIDPLREGWDSDRNRSLHDNPYQSVGYWTPGGRRFVDRLAKD
jgi:hypothetical protein